VKLFNLALSAADNDLLMQFDSRVYFQKRGLAMGVAFSPDLTNLYGVYHELQVLNPNRSATIPLYRRYIDDNLGLVYTLNEEQALE